MATALANEPTQTRVAKSERTRGGERFRPNVDIIERTNELTIVADMPGASGKEIEVQFENGTLTITGRVNARENGKARFLMHEYGVGDFVRTFQVSESVDSSRITAEFKDGVLTLHLPKAEAVRPRKIAVKTE